MPLYITEDRTGDFAARFPEARDAALKAAAQVYANEVKRALAPGYTSGAFVTGRVLNSVTVGAPHDGAIEIGSDLDYAMYWEVGSRWPRSSGRGHRPSQVTTTFSRASMNGSRSGGPRSMQWSQRCSTSLTGRCSRG